MFYHFVNSFLLHLFSPRWDTKLFLAAGVVEAVISVLRFNKIGRGESNSSLRSFAVAEKVC
jgi:hypothetical protein